MVFTAVVIQASLATNTILTFAATPEGSLRFPNAVRPIQDYTGCFPRISSFDFAQWIPPLAFESILCFMMLYKAYALYRQSYHNLLMNLIIRDRCVQLPVTVTLNATLTWLP